MVRARSGSGGVSGQASRCGWRRSRRARFNRARRAAGRLSGRRAARPAPVFPAAGARACSIRRRPLPDQLLVDDEWRAGAGLGPDGRAAGPPAARDGPLHAPHQSGPFQLVFQAEPGMGALRVSRPFSPEAPICCSRRTWSVSASRHAPQAYIYNPEHDRRDARLAHGRAAGLRRPPLKRAARALHLRLLAGRPRDGRAPLRAGAARRSRLPGDGVGGDRRGLRSRWRPVPVRAGGPVEPRYGLPRPPRHFVMPPTTANRWRACSRPRQRRCYAACSTGIMISARSRQLRRPIRAASLRLSSLRISTPDARTGSSRRCETTPFETGRPGPRPECTSEKPT